MDIKINIVEVASELASQELEENWSKSIKIYNEDDLYQHTVYFNINMTRMIVNNAVTKFIQALRIGV